MRTLYVSYFGLREPLVQTQVLPYLRALAAGGVGVSLLTFEPRLKTSWMAEEEASWRSRLEVDGVRWHRLAYHKRPSVPATLYDIAAGARAARRIMASEGAEVFHARGHIPALMGVLVKRLRRCKLLFDIRGFMAEEYVDAGVWPEGGVVHRTFKRAERAAMGSADGFVVLTQRAREILFADSPDPGSDALGRPVAVIPCCVDLRRFGEAAAGTREEARARLGVRGRRVVAYVGALGGWYMTEETAAFLAEVRRRDPAAFFLILTQSDPEMILGPLRRLGVGEADMLVRKVSPDQIGIYLKAADLAVSFIKPCVSKLSSSPTKVAEYLACGLPVIHSAGIGDIDRLIEDDGVGTLVRSFDRDGYVRAFEAVEALRADPGLSGRCEAAAREQFDLERVGGARYLGLYRRLAGRTEA